MKQRLAILAVVVAVAALGCWKALAFYNPAVLEVDLDIDGVADSSEFGTATEPGGPGGFVAKDGWKKITLGYSGTALRMRLNWDSLKISIHPDTNGTAAIANPTLWDIENGATMPTNLWVKGMDASSNGPTTAICGPEHICLEAINNGTGYTNPLYDRVGFTVYDVTNIVAIPKGMTEADVQEPVSIGSGAIASDAHQADVKILVQPAVANIPVDVTLLDGPGQDSSTTATLVIGAATATGGGAAITASTASDGSITGLLTSSDVLTNCTVHAGQKDRPVLFTWDEYAEDEQWINSQEYLPFPGVLTNFVVLRHHRIPTNCTPYKPFDGHEIHFFVEQVEYWDTNGTLCVTNNTPDDPQDLSLFAYFDPEQYTTDQDGRVVSFLQVLTNYDISTVTMVAYDYSIWKSNTTVSSGGGGSGGSGGLTTPANVTVTSGSTGNTRQNSPSTDNNDTGLKVDLDVDSDNDNLFNGDKYPERDNAEESIENAPPGKIVMLNADDDNNDGFVDYNDALINSGVGDKWDDRNDMAVMVAEVKPAWDPLSKAVVLAASSYDKIRVFKKSDGTLLIGPESPTGRVLLPADFAGGKMEMLVEGKSLGSTQITLSFRYLAGAEISRDEVCVSTSCDLQDLGMKLRVQFKDTPMVCTNCPNYLFPPGTIAHGWNYNHGGYSALCPHCFSYCAPTSVKMIADWYGGSMTRDEIYTKQRLDHAGLDVGQMESAFIDALNIPAASMEEFFPTPSMTWRDYMNILVSYRPMLSRIPGHLQVVCGFSGCFGTSNFKVRILCPTFGASWPPGWFMEEDLLTYIAGAPKQTWAYAAPNTPIRPRSQGNASSIVVKSGNPDICNSSGVPSDADSDGLLDFDEKTRFNLAPYNLLWNNADSDGVVPNDRGALHSILWPTP